MVCLKRDSVGVFIDGDYLDGILRSEFESTRMDFMTFSQIIIPEGSHRFRTYYYKSVPYLGSETSDEERYRSEGVEKFLQSLRHLPRFKVRLGELNRSPDGQFKRKGLAVSMTVDVIRLSSERIIDNIFLVCADPEVLPMISAARDMGAIVRLYHGENVPERMLAEVDESVRIDADIVSRCMRPSADNGR
ncbi:MAG: NYN domain-containing protein [Candidatus Thermoplasmatota archaeon]|nr:NYN domain-containing protein [Candidatus Thermoplasmatota archaeon]